MKIEYSEYFGKLKFACEKNGHKLSGTVPNSIISSGEVAINKYVRERMRRHIHQTRKDNVKSRKRAERIKNINVPIFLKHDGHNLKGRTVDYRGPEDQGLITIILESPKKYKGEDSIYGCFGMGMAGIEVFDDDGHLTKWALDRSKESLIEIYERTKKREVAKKMNKV